MRPCLDDPPSWTAAQTPPRRAAEGHLDLGLRFLRIKLCDSNHFSSTIGKGSASMTCKLPIVLGRTFVEIAWLEVGHLKVDILVALVYLWDRMKSRGLPKERASRRCLS